MLVAALAAGIVVVRRRTSASDPAPAPHTTSPAGHLAADGSTVTTQPTAGGVSVTPDPSTTGDEAEPAAPATPDDNAMGYTAPPQHATDPGGHP